MATRNAPSKSSTERVLDSAVRQLGNQALLIQTWNGCSHYGEAIDALRTVTGASEETLRSAVRTLHRAGAIRSLPVRQGAADLTFEEVAMFCLTWNRAATASEAVKQSGLSPTVAYERANILRKMGLSLDNKPDWVFDTLKITRTNLWDGNVDQVNEMLNEELLVRNGLLRRKALLRKVGALTKKLMDLRKDLKVEDCEAFIAIAESALRDLGVTV